MNNLSPAEMLLAKERFPFLPIQTTDELNGTYPVSFEDAALCIAEQRPLFPDPSFIWSYPPETRPGVPVWFRQKIGLDWSPWVFHPWPQSFLFKQQNTEALSADPRALDVPPPDSQEPLK